MAERKKKKRDTGETKGDMTPMIDITFQLLIFFIVTLKFRVLEGRLDAALPKDMGIQTTEVAKIEKIDVLIQVADPGRKVPDPEYRNRSKYEGRRIRYQVGTSTFNNLNQLEQFLNTIPKQDREEQPVTLAPKERTISQDVVEVLDVIVNLGFTTITFEGSFEEE